MVNGPSNTRCTGRRPVPSWAAAGERCSLGTSPGRSHCRGGFRSRLPNGNSRVPGSVTMPIDEATLARVRSAIAHAYPGLPTDPAAIRALAGISATTSYRVCVGGGFVVLRLAFDASAMNGAMVRSRLLREVFAVQTAHRMGIGPRLIHVDYDTGTLLTEYVHGQPMTLARARQRPAIAAVAASALFGSSQWMIMFGGTTRRLPALSFGD